VNIRHPEVPVQLTGEDGNAFMIIGLVQHALREAGVSDEEVSRFHADATSGDYENLLAICMTWVDARFVVCIGRGNHIARRHIWPFRVGDKIVIRCELCGVAWRQRSVSWQQIVRAVE
jgi:hypothetical protein